MSKDIHNRIQFEKLFGDINEIFKRYGIGRGIGFVPDRLKIDLSRDRNEIFDITYREYFTYLPPEITEIAIGNAIELLTKLGVPPEKIVRLEGGVQVTLRGDSDVTSFPVLEMMIQNRGISYDLDSTCDGLKASIRNLLELFEFNYNWTKETETLWENNITRLNEIISSNPELGREIEELVKKYSLNKIQEKASGSV